MLIAPILCAFAASICAFLSNVCVKKIRTSNQKSVFISLGVMGVTGPVFAALWGITSAMDWLVYDYSWAYLQKALLWVVLSSITIPTMMYLIRFVALSGVAAYRKTFAVLFTLLADILIFHEPFGWLTFAAIALLMASGLLLTFERKAISEIEAPPVSALLIFLLHGLLMSVQLVFYKQAVLLQEGVLQHVFLTEGIRLNLFLLLGVGYIFLHRGQVQLHPFYALGGSIMGLGFLFGAFAYASLPLAVVNALAMGTSVLNFTYDIKMKHLPLSRKAIFALILLVIGIILVALT